MGGRNRDLAGVEFDILVALDLLHLHLSSGHSDSEVRFPRHLDSDLKVMVVLCSFVDGKMDLNLSKTLVILMELIAMYDLLFSFLVLFSVVLY